MFWRAREPDLEVARKRMRVEQLESRGIRDRRVLDVMEGLPRHEFVPEELQGRAYEDRPLPIGSDQTISQPYIVARMSELLELRGTERVLEVGAGCGYQSAVLALLADEVCALELQPELVERARANLAGQEIGNVDLRTGDGFMPWPEGGDFDAILCACAPGELPQVLLDQLGAGGRLVLPVGPAGAEQSLQRLTRAPDGSFRRELAGPVRFVPMRRPPSLP